MYSEIVILKNLEEFSAREGWSPVYHTLDQVEEFKDKINKLTKVESNSKNAYVEITRPITENDRKIIKRWIENEQVICSLDYHYWSTRYAWVCDEEGRIFKYQPRLSQRIYDSVIADFDDRHVSIEILCLKARQLGVTTSTALKFIHRLLFIPHTQAIMASVKEKASALIERILDTAYNHSPWWLVPRRMPRASFSNGSILSIQSGMQATGLGQGWTPTLAHLSEIADIPNPRKTIEEGLMRAMHISPALYLVLEGTGGGNTGWLADTWRAAKEDYPKGLHRLFPMFISWPCCPEIYPKKGFLDKFPVENSWQPTLEETRKHVARAESYIRNTSYLARIMGKDYKMPIEQKWFWEWNYRQYAKSHTQKTWAAQMPSDDFESLTGKHDSIFDMEVLGQLEENIYEIKTNISTGMVTRERREIVESYAITGHDVDDEFYPDNDQIDEDKDIIMVRWHSSRGQSYEWELIPLLPSSEDDEKNTMDRLLVFEPPQPRSVYACGIDTADGLGKEDEDRSVVSMTKTATGAYSDEQVCEYCTNRLNSAQIVAFAAAVGAWYSKSCSDPRGVKYVIEQIRGPGDTCQHQLKMMGFHNHHDPQRYDGRKIKEAPSRKQGWYSSGWSVPMLMDRFREAVNGGWYIPKSKWLIEELRTLERHETGGKSKMEHQTGQHDDRVRAAAMSFFTMHDRDILTERAQKRYSLPKKKEAKRKIKTAGDVSVGDW